MENEGKDESATSETNQEKTAKINPGNLSKSVCVVGSRKGLGRRFRLASLAPFPSAKLKESKARVESVPECSDVSSRLHDAQDGKPMKTCNTLDEATLERYWYLKHSVMDVHS